MRVLSVGGADLDEPARAEHRDAVRDASDGAEVV
jgi:hypothetical protein